MENRQVEEDLLLRQYEIAREEISKSVFVQYDVIKIGTLFLSTILVAIPTSYVVLGGDNFLFLSFTMVAFAFIPMSFIFIMGAGEIRIMRAAAFSNKTLRTLVDNDKSKKGRGLVWDEFVSKWNQALYGEGKAWKYQERVYLAMPFIILAALADAGGLAAILIWISKGAIQLWRIGILAIVVLLLALQIWLYAWPARLSRNLARANKECAMD